MFSPIGADLVCHVAILQRHGDAQAAKPVHGGSRVRQTVKVCRQAHAHSPLTEPQPAGFGLHRGCDIGIRIACTYMGDGDQVRAGRTSAAGGALFGANYLRLQCLISPAGSSSSLAGKQRN